jgi:hypothetical protein
MAEVDLSRNEKVVFDNNYSGNCYIKQDNSSNMLFYNNAAAGVAIMSGGNIGLGTASPSGFVEIQPATGQPVVNITNKSDSAYDPQITFRTGATPVERFSIGVDQSDSNRFKISAGQYLGTNDRLVIDANGRVSVLQSFDIYSAGVAPAARIFSSSSVESCVIEFRDCAATPNRWWVGSGCNSGTDGYLVIYDARQSEVRLAIDTSGHVGIGTTYPSHLIHLSGGAYCNGTGDWIPASDQAFKEDVNELTKYGLKEVLLLKPITFVHKQDKSRRVQIGLIAQDVKPLIPEVVEGEDGEMGLAYNRLIPVLINAIKEQQKQIEELKKY